MKRKFAAMVLGMAVTLTSMSSVYAAETETVNGTEQMDEATDAASGENAADHPEFSSAALWGEVMSVDEESITIAAGTLSPNGEKELPEKPEDETGEESPENIIFEEELSVTLVPDEEESTFTITEYTEVYFVHGDTRLETLEQVAADFAGIELTDAESMNAADLSEENADENPDAGEAADVMTDEGTEEIADENAEEMADEAADEITEEVAEEGTEINTAAELAENAESTVSVDKAEISDVLEGDLVGIILDEDGNVQTILVVLPESELIESAEEPAEDAAAEENAAEEVAAEAIEIIEEEVVIE